MLDSLAPTDPILLLAIVDGPFMSLPRDVRAWFGPSRDHRIAFSSPTSLQREHFFLISPSRMSRDLQTRPCVLDIQLWGFNFPPVDLVSTTSNPSITIFPSLQGSPPLFSPVAFYLPPTPSAHAQYSTWGVKPPSCPILPYVPPAPSIITSPSSH